MAVAIPASWTPIASSHSMFDTGTGFTVLVSPSHARFLVDDGGDGPLDPLIPLIFTDWDAVLLHVAPIGFGLTTGVAA